MTATLLHDQLEHLTSAGLVNHAAARQEPHYIFNHALIHEVAYASLLRQDRKRLHRAIALVLERNGADRLDELSPILGQHFAEAGETERAIDYLTRAGRLAFCKYAIPESLMYYTQALQLDSADGNVSSRFQRLIERGQIQEMLSDFHAARKDYEEALRHAQHAQDTVSECHALMHLGMLWAGRDYSLTEEYFMKAHALAAATGDRALIAQTYNRIGNCHLNRNQMELAVAAHQRALALFEELHDERGLMETLDYLGMASFLNGDLTISSQHYERSLALASRFDDRPRMIVALTISAMGSSPFFQTSAFAPADITPPGNLPSALAKMNQGYTIAQTSHLRSQEAFCLCILAMAYCAYGDMGQSLYYADQATQLAAALEHTQWLVYSHVSTGHAAHSIFDFASAHKHLELAVQMAEDMGSWHWRGVSTGALASTYLAIGEMERAADVLSRALPPGTPARMMGQRVAWCSRVELALAQDDPELALQYVELLLADVPDSARGRSMLKVHLLYGHALTALGRFAEAEAKYHMALHVAESHQARTDQWRILAALSRLYDLQGHVQKSIDTLAQARAIAMFIAETINDPAQKALMLSGIEHSLTPGAGVRFI